MNDELAIAPPGAAENIVRELPRVGEHRAVCCHIINIGYQLYQGKPSRSPKAIILFELEQRVTAGDYAGKPMLISEEFPMYLGEGTKLRGFLENWRSAPNAPRPFTTDELNNFTLSKLLRANAKLVIIHNTKGNRTYANIAGIGRPDWDVKLIPTVTEIPKWILDKKAKAVQPAQQQAKPAMATTLPPAAAEDELPF